MADAWYVEHFRQLLKPVAERYAHLLPAADLDFASRFESLPSPARHLYCRLVTRRGPWFRCSALDYPDIGPLGEAITSLIESDLAHWADAPDPVMLRACTRQELADWFQLPAKQKKSDQLAYLDRRDLSPLLHHDRWLHFDQTERRRRLEVCYFGNRHQGFEAFVIAEVGHQRFEAYPLDTRHLHFPDADALEATLQLMRLQDVLQDKLRQADLPQLEAWYSALPVAGYADPRRARVLHDLARQAERLGVPDHARAWHTEGNLPASRERLARMALRAGHPEEATRLLESLLAEGVDPEIRETAAQLLRRHSLGTPPPRFEPVSRRLSLPRDEGSLERQVASALATDGASCLYGENVLHRSLLGLLIWDILFADIPGAFSNAYQRAPLDFREPGFAQRRRSLLDARLHDASDEDWWHIMQRTFAAKHGITNALVHWEYLDSIDWLQAATALTTRVMRAIFERLLQHPGDHGHGLPDLLWWNDQGEVRLIEVKGPGDVLQPHQRAWLEWLARHDVAAEVLHVDLV